MDRIVRHIAVVVKKGDPKAAALAAEVVAWLTERGMTCVTAENCHVACRELTMLDPKPDLMLVVGGDGTMLSAARHAAPNVPLLGLNAGKVGFLTELSAEIWREELLDILSKGARVRKRPYLDCRVFRHDAGEEPALVGRALNDVVLTRAALARLITIEIFALGERLGNLRADGLIISSPMGSTGYAVSAGGPLIHPNLRAISLTPVCPFRGEFHPLVLPGDADLTLKLKRGSQEVFLTLDGQEGFPLQVGDAVRINLSSEAAPFVLPRRASYFASLRAKGFFKDRETEAGP